MRTTACLYFVAVLLCAASAAFGDDGSWSTDFQVSQGPIYSEQENRDISLDKEILALDGFDSGLTRATFFFSNTASAARYVEAGFPVRVHIGVTEDAIPGTEGKTVLFLNKGKYENDVKGQEFIRLVSRGTLEQAPSSDEEVDHSPLYFSKADIPARVQLGADKVTGLFDFSITQDGAPVPYDYVVAESRFVSDPNSGGALEITFNFHHALSFAPRAQSVVKVQYTGDYLSGSDNGGYTFIDQYSYAYILGTGRTWKGPIGQLYLGIPPGTGAKIPRAFVAAGRLGGKDLYLAENYEPAAQDQIELEGRHRKTFEGFYQMIWFDQPVAADPPTRPAQDFVTVLGASSSLKDTAPVYTDDGVIAKASFGPLSLFDGVRETAWSEAVAGDGIGEWVQFSLSKDVQGIIVQNGFTMSFQKVEGKTIDTYYEKNNRPRSIEFVSSDQKVRRSLDLADTRDEQEFDLAPLPKGTYKVFVRAVYPGTKWQDTCLGEITFIPSTAKTARLLTDAFLQAHIADLNGP
jgi:hypothetical protein